MFAKSLRRLYPLAILLLGVGGCGLAEYQSRMDAQRERVKEFDDANRGLDDPIEMPTLPQDKPKVPPKEAAKDEAKDAKQAWPFDFYLRLPKGFGSTPKDKAPVYSTFPCFRYAGPDPAYDIFVAAALVADPKSKDKEEPGRSYTPDVFRFWLRVTIAGFYSKTGNKLELKMPPLDKEKAEPLAFKMLSPFSDVTTKVPYRYYEYSDAGNPKIEKQSVFRVYIHEEPAMVRDEKKEQGKQIAVIVHRPLRTPNDSFDDAVKASLGTLDTSDVGSKRTQYRRLMKR